MEFGFKQKHAFTNQKKCTKTQNKHKKTKARFSDLLRHLAWKWRGPILISLILMSLATYRPAHVVQCVRHSDAMCIGII